MGISPGSSAYLAAFIVAGLIARLTGTPVVIALMAALVVTLMAEVLGGRMAARRIRVTSMTGPRVATVDAPVVVRVEIAGLDESRHGRLRLSNGPGADAEVGSAVLIPGRSGMVEVEAVFRQPGTVHVLDASIELAGPFGLVWWRRRTASIPFAVHFGWDGSPDPLHKRLGSGDEGGLCVAPVPVAELVDVVVSAGRNDGPVAAPRGDQHGDVDGVRTWREGDPVGSIHWPSTLRSGDLVVHDRNAISDQRWEVDLDRFAADPDPAAPGRLRHTLDEGRRRGHAVVVRFAGTEYAVRTDVDAAIWSARAAHALPPTRTAWWQRSIGLPHSIVEPESEVNRRARVAAGVAAATSLALLAGAVGSSVAVVALVIGGVVLGVAVSSWLGRRSGRRPLVLQGAILLAIIGAIALIASDARSVDGLMDALRGPLPQTLMALVVLHGFEVVDRRTLRVHQAITFTVVAYAAGLRIDGALGWWIAAWGVALLTSLAVTDRSPRVPTGRAAARSVVWIGAGGVATLALLSVVPIPDGPARLGLPALSPADAPNASAGGLAAPDGSVTTGDSGEDRASIGRVVGYPGFTESLDTSIRGDLGDDIVMRVRAPEPAFWRGQTFSDFDGRVWSVSADAGQRADGPVIDVPPTIGDAIGTDLPTEQLTQTYYVETALPNLVFAAARPKQIIFDGALWARPDGALRSDVTLAPGSVYTAISERIAVTGETLRGQGDLGDFFGRFREVADSAEIDPFLALPASTTQRTIDLATDLRVASTYDTILAYQAWLAANTEYDLDAPVPAEGDDAVDDFLFDSQRGFCEQIASTLTIMLRSQGVPARLATGYVPGERDRVSGVWKVRASDAHAWVEVWFPQTGWQAFDPTANVPLAGDADAGTVGGDLVGATVSSIGSHLGAIALIGVAAAGAFILIMLVRRRRHRRRRGRWGLLQDRFSALANADASSTSPAKPFTNPGRAALIERRGGPTAMSIAAVLDRVAFDPSWIDDDELYDDTRDAVAALERV